MRAVGVGARSGVYRQPAVPDPEELAVMRWIDQQYLATPFYGSRRMTAALRHAGHRINRKRVQRLMRIMGLEALGPRPKTSRPAAQHRIYPYLLRGLAIGLRVPVERDHGFRRKMIIQSSGT